MLQQAAPDDYVIATGDAHSVREFVEAAFGCAGLDYRDYVVTEEGLYRPAEVNLLLGDPSKARERLKWRHRTNFGELVFEMVSSDCKTLGVESALRRAAVSAS